MTAWKKITTLVRTRAFIMRTTKRKINVSVQSTGQLSCNACIALFSVFFHHNHNGRTYQECISDYRRANSVANWEYIGND